jgi:hypothetical protein
MFEHFCWVPRVPRLRNIIKQATSKSFMMGSDTSESGSGGQHPFAAQQYAARQRRQKRRRLMLNLDEHSGLPMASNPDEIQRELLTPDSAAFQPQEWQGGVPTSQSRSWQSGFSVSDVAALQPQERLSGEPTSSQPQPQQSGVSTDATPVVQSHANPLGAHALQPKPRGTQPQCHNSSVVPSAAATNCNARAATDCTPADENSLKHIIKQLSAAFDGGDMVLRLSSSGNELHINVGPGTAASCSLTKRDWMAPAAFDLFREWLLRKVIFRGKGVVLTTAADPLSAGSRGQGISAATTRLPVAFVFEGKSLIKRLLQEGCWIPRFAHPTVGLVDIQLLAWLCNPERKWSSVAVIAEEFVRPAARGGGCGTSTADEVIKAAGQRLLEVLPPNLHSVLQLEADVQVRSYRKLDAHHLTAFMLLPFPLLSLGVLNCPVATVHISHTHFSISYPQLY